MTSILGEHRGYWPHSLEPDREHGSRCWTHKPKIIYFSGVLGTCFPNLSLNKLCGHKSPLSPQWLHHFLFNEQWKGENLQSTFILTLTDLTFFLETDLITLYLPSLKPKCLGSYSSLLILTLLKAVTVSISSTLKRVLLELKCLEMNRIGLERMRLHWLALHWTGLYRIERCKEGEQTLETMFLYI